MGPVKIVALFTSFPTSIESVYPQKSSHRLHVQYNSSNESTVIFSSCRLVLRLQKSGMFSFSTTKHLERRTQNELQQLRLSIVLTSAPAAQTALLLHRCRTVHVCRMKTVVTSSHFGSGCYLPVSQTAGRHRAGRIPHGSWGRRCAAA